MTVSYQVFPLDQLPDRCYAGAARPQGELRAPLGVDLEAATQGLYLEALSEDCQGHLVEVGEGCQVQAHLRLGRNSVVRLGAEVQGRLTATLWFNTTLALGPRTTANHLQCEVMNGTVEIGEDCMLSEVWIQGSDMHGIWDLTSGQRINEPGHKIVIGDHVWLGRQVCLVGSCRIGTGSLVGFSSVVTKDLPERVLAVGNPARVIKEEVSWTRTFEEGDWHRLRDSGILHPT